MATIEQLEEQIFRREGFRVKFVPLDAKTKRVSDYDFPVMASNKWRVSDWKNQRLAAYMASFRSVTIFRGDGKPLKTDMRLGNLRDSYFEATYGDESVKPESTEATSDKVSPLRKRAPVTSNGKRRAR